MRIVVSVPQETLHSAAQAATERGVSLSEFFVTAVNQYLFVLAAERLVDQIDEAVDRGMISVQREASRAVADGARRLIGFTGDDTW